MRTVAETMACFALIVSRLAVGSSPLAAPPPQVLDHLSGSLTLRTDGYLHAPATHPELTDDGHATTEAVLDWETWMRVDQLRLDVGGWFEAGSPSSHRWTGGMAWFQDDESLSRHAEIDRLLLTCSAGNDGEWELTAGKGVFRNSLAVIGTLADSHTLAYDANDPLNPKRLGVWQARLDHLTDSGQFSLVALPVFQPAKLPSEESRWYIDEAGFARPHLLPSMTLRVEDDIPGCHVPELGWFARYAGKSPALDWFVQAYRGHSDPAAYRLTKVTWDEVVIEKDHSPCWEGAAGWSTSHGPWEFHGETVYHRPDGDRDDELVTYVIGSTRRLLRIAEALNCDDISFTLEYLGEWVVQEMEPTLDYAIGSYVASSDLFRQGSAVLSELAIVVNPDRSIRFQSLNDLDGENFHVFRLEATQKITDNLRVSVEGALLNGSDALFSSWGSNDRLGVVLTYDF